MSTGGVPAPKAQIPWIWIIGAVIATTCLVCPCGIGAALWLGNWRGPSAGTPGGGGTDNKAVEAKQDKDAIQGQWAVVSSAEAGTAIPAEALARSSFSFTADTIKVWKDGDLWEERFTLDPTKSPKQIDIRDKDGKVKLGIYELSGDDLKLCVDNSGKGRPSSFTGVGDNVIFVLKRK